MANDRLNIQSITEFFQQSNIHIDQRNVIRF